MTTIAQLIEQIRETPYRFILVATGGGSQRIAEWLACPPWRNLLEVFQPQTENDLAAWLGGSPPQSDLAETARSLAAAAFWRGRHGGGKSADPDRLLGVAYVDQLSAKSRGDGGGCICVAIQSAQATVTCSLHWPGGQEQKASRDQQDRVAAELVVQQIARACGVNSASKVGEVSTHQQLKSSRTEAEPAWRQLFLGEIDAACQGGSPPKAVRGRGNPLCSGAVFPGAFHPLHEGHRGMQRVAQQTLDRPVEFELSVLNVDKPPLNYTDLAARVAQFSQQDALWLTRAPTFVEKSQIFPQATFIVGADTIARIADPKYYQNQVACTEAIRRIADQGCRFLVFGRLCGQTYVSLLDLTLPASLAALCESVPADRFRCDVSSTQLRQRGADEPG